MEPRKTSTMPAAIAAPVKAAPLPPSAERERQDWIAENAYYRSRQRNIDDGDPVSDWLQAEQEYESRQQKLH